MFTVRMLFAPNSANSCITRQNKSSVIAAFSTQTQHSINTASPQIVNVCGEGLIELDADTETFGADLWGAKLQPSVRHVPPAADSTSPSSQSRACGGGRGGSGGRERGREEKIRS